MGTRTSALPQNSSLEKISELRAHAPESVLGRAFLEERDELSMAVLVAQAQEGAQEVFGQLLAILVADDFQQPRYRVLSEFAPLVVPTLLAIGGTEALDRMLEAIDAADTRLLEAAHVVAQG